MFDDLKKNKNDNLGKTQPNHPVAPKIERNPFEQIMELADFDFDQKPKETADKDELRLLGPDDVLDWPSHGNKGASDCSKAVHTPKYLKAANFSLRNSLLNSARSATPDWMREDDGNTDLPSWLTANDNDLFAQHGLPTASRNKIPGWMKEQNSTSNPPIWITGDDIDLNVQNGLPEPKKERFDPNETQKVIAVKKPDAVLVKKGRTALLVIGVYVVLLNLIFWNVPTGIDNILIDVFGIYLTIYLAGMGYDVRNLIPLIKQK